MEFNVLQIFLLANFLLIGILLTIAVQHAYAHFHPPKIEKPVPRPPAQNGRLPADVRQRMIEEAEGNFETVLDRSAGELEKDLETTAVKIDKQLQKFGSDVISDEMQRYHETLQKLRTQTEVTMNGAQVSITNHQAELQAKLEEQAAALETKLNENVAAEQRRRIEEIDTKLSDAVIAFLVETLQHNVDLGAQANYLTSMLEEHKAELTKGIRDEA